MARTRRYLRLVPSDGGEEWPASSRHRYAGLPDRRLASILAAEDTAERFGLSPHVRSTCHVHQCWFHQCVSDPVHVSVPTGHRWCGRCEFPADVHVDETTGTVVLHCRQCGCDPDSDANREVLFACHTSLSAMRAGGSPALYPVPDP